MLKSYLNFKHNNVSRMEQATMSKTL